MLIDDLTIRIRSGDGGDGTVAFSGNMLTLGPTGGSGGRGGNVYFVGVSDLGALNGLGKKKVFQAESGGKGRHRLNDGPAGKDLFIQIPIGTVIHNLTNNRDEELVGLGEKILGAQGGLGGKGNFHFRGPHNTSPKEAQKGLLGEEFTIRLELKLIADIGLIGLPNAGKSSLLNALTNAKSKVANYHFTTLEPNLGVFYEVILADIPGLIEGASQGKGLGVKFLRHVERTRILFHLIAADSTDVVQDYKTIRDELGAYNKKLLKKDEFLFLSKADVVSKKDKEEKLKQLKKINPKVIPLSINETETLTEVKKILNQIIEQKKI